MGIYHIDASSRGEGSVTRKLSKLMVDKLINKADQKITYRDVGQAQGIKFLDQTIVSGLFIPEENKTEIQKESLRESDHIVKEAQENDT